MVSIDASSRWSHIYLLSSQNLARLLAQIVKLRAQFSKYTIKIIRLDNVDTFQAIDNYCMSIWISVEHPTANVHTQNDFA